MKFLVIGSKGFIGANLTIYLREKGDSVTECDVHTDYGNEYYIQVSVLDADFDHIFSLRPFDICVNCSGAASVADSFKNQARDFQLNVTNVQRMLHSLSKYQPQCRFVNLSSAAVYGNPTALPLVESMPAHPISPYGYHKKLSELILSQFTDLHQIQTVSLRIFSAYGEGLKKQIVWDLYHKMKRSSKIELFGTGNETRDFIHVQDLVSAIRVVSEQPSFENTVINVATGSETTITDLASKFAKALGWEGEILFSKNARIGDPDNWRADISKLVSLGFTPTISLDTGLKIYAEWAKERF
ncbi:MAG: NAD-dependent epimerase/dehydratase family protein [Cyclobacteriaceae bacterium]